MKILVLCHGNVNRSPLCAAVLMKHFPELEIRQAGLKPGLRPGVAAKKMREAAAKSGYYLDTHKSQMISPELVIWADVVVIMDGGNQKRYINTCITYSSASPPFTATPYVLLGRFANKPQARVPDPAFMNKFDPKFPKVLDLIIESSLNLGAEAIDPDSDLTKLVGVSS